MRAIVCAAPGRLEFTDIAEPVRQPGQVLVKMRRMGICGTDMHIYGGRQPFFEYPRIIGHALSGEVAEADAGSGSHDRIPRCGCACRRPLRCRGGTVRAGRRR